MHMPVHMVVFASFFAARAKHKMLCRETPHQVMCSQHHTIDGSVLAILTGPSLGAYCVPHTARVFLQHPCATTKKRHG